MEGYMDIYRDERLGKMTATKIIEEEVGYA